MTATSAPADTKDTSDLFPLDIQEVKYATRDKNLPPIGAQPQRAPTSTFWEFVDFRGHGNMDLRFNFPGEVNGQSQVMASLTEVGPNGPFLALASLDVHNISPRNDGAVFVRVSIGWPSDLPVRINFIIFN